MMTNRTETPARKAKRVHVDESRNEVQIIQQEESEAAPSIAARNHVKTAMASHLDAIKRIAMSLSKDYTALKAKYQQKELTKTKLDNDAAFMPRSAMVAFKLTAPPSIMETTDFKALTTAMDEKTKEYSEFCKQSIASVAKLVNDGMKTEITDVFTKGLLQLSTLLLTQQDPFQKEQPVDYFTLFVLSNLPDEIFIETFASKIKMQTDMMNRLSSTTEPPATQKTVVIPPDLQGPFTLLKLTLYTLLKVVFVENVAKYKAQVCINKVKKCLERQATKFLTGEATTATTMELDAEPSSDPKIIRALINDKIKKKTAKLQTEMQKLRDTVKRPPDKNSARGAPASSNTQSAPSPNKNKNPKGNTKKEEGNIKGKSDKPKKINKNNKKGASVATNNSGSHNKNGKKKTNTGPLSNKKKSGRQQQRSKTS